MALHLQPGVRGFVPLVSVVHNFYMSLPARLSALGLGMLVGLLILCPGAVERIRRLWVLATVVAGGKRVWVERG